MFRQCRNYIIDKWLQLFIMISTVHVNVITLATIITMVTPITRIIMITTHTEVTIILWLHYLQWLWRLQLEQWLQLKLLKDELYWLLHLQWLQVTMITLITVKTSTCWAHTPSTVFSKGANSVFWEIGTKMKACLEWSDNTDVQINVI